MRTSGHKINRTEHERSSPKKQNKKNTTAGIIVNTASEAGNQITQSIILLSLHRLKHNNNPKNTRP